MLSRYILTSIFCARSEGLKLDLMTTLTSSFVRPTSRTSGMTRKGRMMSLVVRYLHVQIEDALRHNQTLECEDRRMLN